MMFLFGDNLSINKGRMIVQKVARIGLPILIRQWGLHPGQNVVSLGQNGLSSQPGCACPNL